MAVWKDYRGTLEVLESVNFIYTQDLWLVDEEYTSYSAVVITPNRLNPYYIDSDYVFSVTDLATIEFLLGVDLSLSNQLDVFQLNFEDVEEINPIDGFNLNSETMIVLPEGDYYRHIFQVPLDYFVNFITGRLKYVWINTLPMSGDFNESIYEITIGHPSQVYRFSPSLDVAVPNWSG